MCVGGPTAHPLWAHPRPHAPKAGAAQPEYPNQPVCLVWLACGAVRCETCLAASGAYFAGSYRISNQFLHRSARIARVLHGYCKGFDAPPWTTLVPNGIRRQCGSPIRLMGAPFERGWRVSWAAGVVATIVLRTDVVHIDHTWRVRDVCRKLPIYLDTCFRQGTSTRPGGRPAREAARRPRQERSSSPRGLSTSGRNCLKATCSPPPRACQFSFPTISARILSEVRLASMAGVATANGAAQTNTATVRNECRRTGAEVASMLSVRRVPRLTLLIRRLAERPAISRLPDAHHLPCC